MCGISIIIDSTNQGVKENVIKSFNDKVAHRGPNDEGFHIAKNFAFGHRRLSILDLSTAGHQPMSWEHLCITYNGEIYNYLELRAELMQKGYTFRSGTDTEVILAAYDAWGVESFSRFNGMWAFAIHDARKDEIIFSRDHFGIKPLYYAQTGRYFSAASEIKQFTALDEFRPVLNKETAVNFLVAGWLNYSEQTFFKGVQELKAGHYLTYKLSSHALKIVQWYDLGKASVRVDDNYGEAVKKMRDLFIDSVRVRMRSDVRVGSCLSGGIDSSSIVGVIHSEKLANEDFATITSCYKEKGYDEQEFSDLVTEQTSFNSAKVYPDLDDLLNEGHLDKMLYHQDQPFSGASHYSEFNVFKKASEEKMIVMQDGQGSDEFLCGYGEFYIARMRELLTSFQWGQAVKLIKTKASHKQTGFFQEARAFVRTAYGYPAITFAKKLTGQAVPTWLSTEWQEMAKDKLRDFPSHSIRAISLAEIEYSSIPYQLHSEDRNSMLFSIESRLPFLDHRLVEYGIGLPSEYKIRGGYTKAVLRDAIRELPTPIKTRKDKMGFVAPDPVWVKQNQKKVREDLQYIVSSGNIFSPALLDRFDRFIAGDLGYEPIYFRAMAFSRFCKIFKMEIEQ